MRLSLWQIILPSIITFVELYEERRFIFMNGPPSKFLMVTCIMISIQLLKYTSIRTKENQLYRGTTLILINLISFLFSFKGTEILKVQNDSFLFEFFLPILFAYIFLIYYLEEYQKLCLTNFFTLICVHSYNKAIFQITQNCYAIWILLLLIIIHVISFVIFSGVAFES